MHIIQKQNKKLYKNIINIIKHYYYGLRNW